VSHGVGRLAAQHVAQAPVAMRGHGDEVGAGLLGHPDDLGGRVAHRQPGLDLQPPRRELVAQPLQVGAILSHLLGLPQLELVVVARGPPVGDVDNDELAAGQLRQTLHVIDDRPVGGRVLDWDEDPLVHLPSLRASPCLKEVRRSSGRAARR
jgi:hypothetical protein